MRTLTFSVGETSRAILVTVVGDSETEFDETFYVGLANAVGTTVTQAHPSGPVISIELTDSASSGTSTVAMTDTLSISTGSA